jgi:hypothetical protein
MQWRFIPYLDGIKKPRMCGASVPQAGIEPAHLTVHDFESCASTSSATKACFDQRAG